MTKKELDFIGSMNMCDEISNEAYKKIVNHVEETEISDDCVSRQAVLDILSHYAHNFGADNEIKALSSVTPTLPKGATNGDILKIVFPNIEADEIKTNTGGYIEVKYLDTTDKCDATAFRKNWWNAPYKRGDENGSN